MSSGERFAFYNHVVLQFFDTFGQPSDLQDRDDPEQVFLLRVVNYFEGREELLSAENGGSDDEEDEGETSEYEEPPDSATNTTYNRSRSQTAWTDTHHNQLSD